MRYLFFSARLFSVSSAGNYNFLGRELEFPAEETEKSMAYRYKKERDQT